MSKDPAEGMTRFGQESLNIKRQRLWVKCFEEARKMHTDVNLTQHHVRTVIKTADLIFEAALEAHQRAQETPLKEDQ